MSSARDDEPSSPPSPSLPTTKDSKPVFTNHKASQSRASVSSQHVPLNYFARRSESLRVSARGATDDLEPAIDSNETGRSAQVPEEWTLNEVDFRFDVFLQEQWDQAVNEGIQTRDIGVTFKDLKVVGLGADTIYQPTIGSVLNPMSIFQAIQDIRHPPVKDILSGFEGTVRPGEMLLVLGKPGSGCSTFLKVLAGQHSGYKAVAGELSYDGLSPAYMKKHCRGDLGYSPEDDIHFPTLTVRQTLNVSAAARTPRVRPGGISRKEYINRVVDTLGTVFGLKHTFDTPVGDEHIRGVSGGEKKRVSIAEMMSMLVRVACWDNSTRGLDSSTALEFVHALRIATDIARVTSIVSIYQASDNIYQMFDKVAVIAEGRLVYFGPADRARPYFINMGYEPANRQTTADFLVSVTDPLLRVVRAGFEALVPRTPDEFAKQFINSPLGQRNAAEVQEQLHDASCDEKVSMYKASARAQHAKHMPPGSPYTVSLLMQLQILMIRRFQIVRGDIFTEFVRLLNFMIQALVIGSLFFKLPVNTGTYFSRSGTLFFSLLFAGLTSMAEMVGMYAQRPIVSRHHKAALYHPFLDALALTLVDMPITLWCIGSFGVILYFMTGLQAAASRFFIFVLFIYLSTLTMKAFFRAMTATFEQAQAQAFAGMGVLAVIIYTGFAIPPPSMIGALKWIRFINPLRYSYESLISNEFHGLNGACESLVPSGPGYENVTIANQVCATLGALPGQTTVSGDLYIALNYQYNHSNLWRNLGILIAFWVGFLAWFSYMTERDKTDATGATRLMFKRGAVIPDRDEVKAKENGGQLNKVSTTAVKDTVPKSENIFSWHHLNYDIELSNGSQRRLLDDISGYVAPGKLTALMGESGAGKTTLLNALAGRIRIGVLTGDLFVNGGPLPADFLAQTGYCQQMNIHLETTTVREALRFSAELRQPASVSTKEKHDYVEEVIRMCNMEVYADAIVGNIGEGLNVEQRKRLTIGVELAAKPQLLLFLDEPTSGLDSQSAWAIIGFLRSLASNGQAILCTIHQPSAELFQDFDRILLLRKGGQTCYFGDLGQNATKLISYFERNGGRKCEDGENPAEYMLDVIGAGATARSTVDWHSAWKDSPERLEMNRELDEILAHGKDDNNTFVQHAQTNRFAASMFVQMRELTRRGFLSRLRDPAYLLGKYVIDISAGLFIGFTYYKVKPTVQGAQNQLFAVFISFILAVPHSNLLQVPFLRSRQIYEARERASEMYHWISFVTTSLLVDIPFNILGGTLFFVCWYWTIGLPKAAHLAGFEYLCLGILFPLFYTSLSLAVAAISPKAEVAGLTFNFLFSFTVVFSGVLQPFRQLISFWHWMYRLSPFTYLVEALVSNGLGNQEIRCAPVEFVTLQPPRGFRCASYMKNFIAFHGGYLANPTATANCELCPYSSSNANLAVDNMFFSHRWRDAGFVAAYVAFNIGLLYVVFYLFRIRSGHSSRSIMKRLRPTET